MLALHVLSFSLAISWQGQRCTDKQKVDTALTQKRELVALCPHVISQWLLGSLQGKQPLWRRHSPEIVRFQDTEFQRYLLVTLPGPPQESTVFQEAPPKGGSPFPAPTINLPLVERFDLEKKWNGKLSKCWLTAFRYCGSLGKDSNYYGGKGSCMRTHRAFFSTEGGEDKTHTLVGSLSQMNII